MTPTEAQQAMIDKGLLTMWTVYDKPTDYPTEFVARLHVAGRLQGGIEGKATGFHAAVAGDGALIRGKTLQAVRDHLPAGLHCLGRDPADEPHIVEVWL